MIFRLEVVVRFTLVWQGVQLVEDQFSSSAAREFTVSFCTCGSGWFEAQASVSRKVLRMDNDNLLFYDDLSVGDRWVSPSRQVTEADVAQFADLTGDYDPLHVDEEFAKQTPFRQPIAHGLLGLSLVAGVGSESPNVETVVFLGVQDWKFLKPIFFDDSVHVVTTVKTLQSNGRRRGHVTWHRQLVNHDGIVVQEGILLSLVARRSASLHRHQIANPDLAATQQ